MSYLKTFLLCVVGALAALFFLQSLALADASAGGSSVSSLSVALPNGWAGLVMLVLVAASWAMRKYTDVPFFHTTLGAAMMGILSSLIPSLIDGIKVGGLTVAVAQTAVYGAVLSFFASDNASARGDDQKQRVLAMKIKRAPTPPAPVRPGTLSMLLPLAFVLALAGCPTPGGQALAKCEVGTLPSAAGALIAQLVAVAFSGGNYQQQLEADGIAAAQNNAGPQFNCAVQAVSAWLDSSAPRGEITAARREASSAFKAYVTTHKPTACGPIKQIEPRCIPLYSAAYSAQPRG